MLREGGILLFNSLIYAQRPDATMVETYNDWREKGSKGIAIIDSAHYRPYVDHVFDISDTNGRARPEIWRLDKENEKEILALLHAKSGNVQGYVREAVEAESYGKDKDYIEKISDLCRFHDSQNPEHIYDITNAVIQSAQYMAAVRIRAEPPPACTCHRPKAYDIWSLQYRTFCSRAGAERDRKSL